MTSPQIDPGIPRVPARQVILSAAALWLCYFLLITVRGLVVELGDFTDLLWRRGLVTLAGIIVTVACWPLLRRFDARSLAVRVGAALVIMLPAALALAAVNQWAFAPVEKRMLERLTHDEDADPAKAPDKVTVEDSSKNPAVKIRRDMAGNVLVDVLDEGIVAPVIPVPPEPPEPAPRAVSSPPPAPKVSPSPEPLLDDDDIAEIEKLAEARATSALRMAGIVRNADGSTVISQPGVVIRQYADGRSEVRIGNKVYRDDGDGELTSPEMALPAPPAPPQPGATAMPPAPPAPPAAVRESARREAQAALRQAEAARRAALAQARAEAERARAEVRQARQRAAQSAPTPTPSKVATRPETTVSKKPVTSAPATPAPTEAAPPQAAATDVATSTSKVTIIRQLVEKEGLWRQLTDVALGRYFLLIAWAALYLALGNGEQLRAAEYREGEYRRAAKAAELRSLRYQVNPHFLFNTLNSLSALVMVGRSEQAEKMIQSISRFYRHSLAGDPTTDMPLEDEIALQRHYLEIEAVRFPERLRCDFDVPDDLMSACVPGMILQPLVENSIKYGVSTTIRPVTIRISAREAGGFLILTVADDGPGEGLASGSTGIGLENVKSRLIARFGDEAKVESGPLPAGGYATVLTMPVVRNEC
ncbi:histidine kinase [Novosphingobium sp. ERN07]|uniref:sensor histidine kinase n=1 Tax=Novosphingobium sp. ERN07 TaxID=2726187 RepID=UPI00351AB62B